MPTRLTCGFSYSCQLSVDGLASGGSRPAGKVILSWLTGLIDLLEADEGVDRIVVVLERVALGFGQDVLVGAGKIVGGTEVEHGGAQHALVGAADLGGEDAGKDELALHFLVAQLDVEVVAGGASRMRGMGARQKAAQTKQNSAAICLMCNRSPERMRGEPMGRLRALSNMQCCARHPPARTLCAPSSYSGKMTGSGRCLRPGPGRVVTRGLTPHNRAGRLAMDASLANRVRSGRKQP